MDIIGFDKETKIPVIVPPEGKPVALGPVVHTLDPTLIRQQADAIIAKLMRRKQFEKAASNLAKRTGADRYWFNISLFLESPRRYIHDHMTDKRRTRIERRAQKLHLTYK